MTEFSPTLYAEFAIILGEIPARGAYQPTPPSIRLPPKLCGLYPPLRLLNWACVNINTGMVNNFQHSFTLSNKLTAVLKCLYFDKSSRLEGV